MVGWTKLCVCVWGCGLRAGAWAWGRGHVIQGLAKTDWGWVGCPGNWPDLGKTQAPLKRGAQEVVSSPCEFTVKPGFLFLL